MATSNDKSTRKVLTIGTKVKLDNAPLFRTEDYPTSHRTLTGVFFLYDGKCINGRYKVVSSKHSVKYKPESMVFIGWVEEKHLGIV